MERIYCFNRKILDNYKIDDAFVPFKEELWNKILENRELLIRQDAEMNFDFKQLVVYVLIKSKNLFLTYQRTQNTTEERLRNEYSIGIGGHVNIEDSSSLEFDNHTILKRAVDRELNEEVNIKAKIVASPKLVGFINDDSNEVGRVHFGVVYLLEIEEPSAGIRKAAGLGKIYFYKYDELKARYQFFENWSKIVIEKLDFIMETK